MKTTRELALDVLHPIFASMFSRDTFIAMVADPGDRGELLRALRDRIEMVILVDRGQIEKSKAPS